MGLVLVNTFLNYLEQNRTYRTYIYKASGFQHVRSLANTLAGKN